MSAEKGNLLFESPERLHRLTDVIFAISLVLFLLTGISAANGEKFWDAYQIDPGKFVLEQAYKLFISFLVFLFMAIYWHTNAKQSKYLVKVDSTYTWINILYLFFISVAPFPNALSIQYGSDIYVQLFFGLVMFFIGILSFFGWFYASRNHRLVRQDITDTEIRSINLEMSVEPLVAVLSIITTLFIPALWELVLLLLPIGIVLITLFNNRQKKKPVSAG